MGLPATTLPRPHTEPSLSGPAPASDIRRPQRSLAVLTGHADAESVLPEPPWAAAMSKPFCTFVTYIGNSRDGKVAEISQCECRLFIVQEVAKFTKEAG